MGQHTLEQYNNTARHEHLRDDIKDRTKTRKGSHKNKRGFAEILQYTHNIFAESSSQIQQNYKAVHVWPISRGEKDTNQPGLRFPKRHFNKLIVNILTY
jgi:hypothetical protein